MSEFSSRVERGRDGWFGGGLCLELEEAPSLIYVCLGMGVGGWMKLCLEVKTGCRVTRTR